jgi:hypothetical protein
MKDIGLTDVGIEPAEDSSNGWVVGDTTVVLRGDEDLFLGILFYSLHQLVTIHFVSPYSRSLILHNEQCPQRPTLPRGPPFRSRKLSCLWES